MAKELTKVSLQKPNNRFGSPARVIANALSIFVLSQLIATGLVVAAIAAFKAGPGVLDSFNNSTLAQFIFIVLAEGLATLLVIWFLRRQRIDLKAIGLRRPRWQDISRGTTGFLLFYVLLIIVSIVLSFIFPSINNTPQDVGFNNAVGTGEALAFIGLVFLPPIGEEILVRGYLFSGLRSRMTFFRAGLITSVLFSFAHLQLGGGTAPVWGAAADTFVLSWVLVWLRESTGALYAGMVVHMLNNLVAFFVKFH